MSGRPARRAALLLGLALAGQGQADTGLLLGLRADRAASALYRTLYITDDGRSVRLRAQDRSTLLFPTPQGAFARVSVTRDASPDGVFFREHLGIGWAGTVGHPRPVELGPAACVPVNTRWALLFVSSALASFELRLSAPPSAACGAAGLPFGNPLVHLRLKAIPADALYSVFSDDPVQVQDDAVTELARLFGPQAWPALQAAWRKTFASLPTSARLNLRDLGLERADPGNWAVVRRSGRWALRARVATQTFDVPVPLPAALTGWDSLALPWAAVRARVPDALDAFTSPDGRLLGVLTARTLSVYRLGGAAFGPPALVLPLEAPESAVLIQWAGGAQVGRWGAELDRFSTQESR